VVILEGEAIDDLEPRFGTLLLGDRDGSVQLETVGWPAP
jgi:hypothetical protein